METFDSFTDLSGSANVPSSDYNVFNSGSIPPDKPRKWASPDEYEDYQQFKQWLQNGGCREFAKQEGIKLIEKTQDVLLEDFSNRMEKYVREKLLKVFTSEPE